MYGDFSRNSFDPVKAFSGVLLQQGRLHLDSDFNEQAAITLHLVRTALRDLIGRHGGPADEGELGFALAANRPALEELITRRQRGYAANFADVSAQRLLAGDILIAPGRYYVNGILVENPSPCWLSDQPTFALTSQEDPAQPPLSLAALQERPHLLYLEVWDRSVDAIEDPSIPEVALEGTDTCVRTQVAWQVRVRALDTATVGATSEDLLALIDEEVGTQSQCTLKARTRPPENAGDPMPAGYTGHENRLYRVEIHSAAVDGTPRLKWSRNNAASSAAITSWAPLDRSPGQTLKLQLGPWGAGTVTTLAPGTWVEVVNACLVKGARTGALARVRERENDRQQVLVEDPSGRVRPILERDGQPVLRVWHHHGEPGAGGAIPVAVSSGSDDLWLPLEDGIEVAVGGGPFRPGDYWLVPARTHSAQILWPTSPFSTDPAAHPPHGIQRHVAPLAVADREGNLRDLRRRIRPITT